MPKDGQKKHKIEAVLAAIHDSAGIKTTIARRLGVTRWTVDRYLLHYPSAALAYKIEVESVGDFVETVILKSIKAEDIETAKWYAKNKLKDRGYTERIEYKEIKEMSDAELIAFIQREIGAVGSGDSPSEKPESADPTIH